MLFPWCSCGIRHVELLGVRVIFTDRGVLVTAAALVQKLAVQMALCIIVAVYFPPPLSQGTGRGSRAANGSWVYTSSVFTMSWVLASPVWPGLKEPVRSVPPVTPAIVAFAVLQWRAGGRSSNMPRPGGSRLISVCRSSMFDNPALPIPAGSVLVHLSAARWPPQRLEQLLASARWFRPLVDSACSPRLRGAAVVRLVGLLAAAGPRFLRRARVLIVPICLATAGLACRSA